LQVQKEEDRLIKAKYPYTPLLENDEQSSNEQNHKRITLQHILEVQRKELQANDDVRKRKTQYNKPYYNLENDEPSSQKEVD